MAHAASSVEEQAAKALHTPLLAARAEVEAALDTAAFPRDDLRVCIEELQAERVKMEELFCETIAAECAAVQDARSRRHWAPGRLRDSPGAHRLQLRRRRQRPGRR